MIYHVKALVRPERVDGVLHALRAVAGVAGIITMGVRGFGRKVMTSGEPASESAEVQLMGIETVVDELVLEEVLRSIQTAARTGRHGDGKIFVWPVFEAIRIRTGERGPGAL